MIIVKAINLGYQVKDIRFWFITFIILCRVSYKLLLKGSVVYPKKLLDNGYEFKFKNIELALKNLSDN